MEIPFPAADSVWAAEDPITWYDRLASTPQSATFRNALRELTSRGQIPDKIDSQPLWILLHGLLSVSWTLLWRDLGDLSMVSESKISQWKQNLARSFEVWEQRLSNTPSRQNDTLLQSGLPFSRLGHVLLLTDTEKIRIFAGASSRSNARVALTYRCSWSAYLARGVGVGQHICDDMGSVRGLGSGGEGVLAK